MKLSSNAGAHHHSEAEERRIREAALDKTIEASFPASDPPSTNPNPDAHDAVEQVVPDDADTASKG
jgi:hypothetical protein